MFLINNKSIMLPSRNCNYDVRLKVFFGWNENGHGNFIFLFFTSQQKQEAFSAGATQ